MHHQDDASITLGALLRHRQPERDQLAADVEAFLAAGGEVEQLPVEASSQDRHKTIEERKAAATARWRDGAV